MNKLTKTTIVYSLVGLLQVGIGAAAAPADPTPVPGNENQPRYEERVKDREQLIQEENKRHEEEMKRRPHESDQEWKDRQEQEILRHEKALRDIEQGFPAKPDNQ
ncbi:MAG: hypothetical protein E6X17_04805 [Sporomusaceae bacterium]|nr:hypothetical protein [Sporomusaceae bacterium]